MAKIGDRANAKCPRCGAAVTYAAWTVVENPFSQAYAHTVLIEGWRCDRGHDVPDDFDPNAEMLSNA